MKVKFNVQYHSNWGQAVYIVGSDHLLGNWDLGQAVPMNYAGSNIWSVEFETDKQNTFEYKYVVGEANGVFVWEGGNNRNLNTSDYQLMVVNDIWKPIVDHNRVLMTKVFTEVIMKPAQLFPQANLPRTKNTIRFTLVEPRVGVGCGMAILGSTASTGLWEEPVLMSNQNYPQWELELDSDGIGNELSYKYVIIDRATLKVVLWEEGENRVVNSLDNKSESAVNVINDFAFRHSMKGWKGAGVAVPVFSLRTNDSFGAGEFNDIKKLVDWCVKTNLKMIQVLPINETVATHSWLDSYPYKSITVMALHPMYLHLPALGKLNNKDLMKEFETIKETLNSYESVDYVAVTKNKSRYFKLIFDQNWKKVSSTISYKKFFEENKDWLVPYAAFCYLRDQYKTSEFSTWGDYAVYKPDQIAALTDPAQPFFEHIAVHYFIQYHLDKQLREVVDYAHAKGIGLKGDIPIGISPNSIEAWVAPQLFNLNVQAGAPPDDFAMMGQNWGFPTYNWDIMALDDFAWWRNRLRMMEKYFDAYRIDHILGFFRIWEIPQHALHGLLGYFKPGLPLSPSDIEDLGIWFDFDRFVKPYIRGHFLHDFFGEYTKEIKIKYLIEIDDDHFELKPEWNTQRKIYNYFTPSNGSNEMTSKNLVIRDGLMSLLNEVLFVADPYAQHQAYHPRIAFHFTYSYRELDDYIKEILNDLYIQFFYKRHDEFWKQHALSKIPSIVAASNMLVCGEDLGMVPDCVPEVMKMQNILSLEIQRMPKNPRIEFGHPNDADYLSVCTTSTHDMSTIRGWWEEDRARTQRYYNHILGMNDQAPYFAEPWICKEIIKQHLHSPAMWTIFPIQDLIAMDGNLRWDNTQKEQINVPGNPENKWQYRMILTLEQLLEADELNALISSLIHLSSRDKWM